MRVGKKSAWLTLVMVVLWATEPALACLVPPRLDDCCRQMMEQSCSCNMDASQSCCQVRESNSSVPLGGVSNTEQSITLIPVDTGSVVLQASPGNWSISTLDAAPSSPRIGSSVLRI